MVAEPFVVEFRENGHGSVVDRMQAMARERRGWLNLMPGLDVDEPPPERSTFGSWFSARGPTVPLGTWRPAQRRDPATAGIQHGWGPKATEYLAEVGMPVPDTWRIIQDHAKRGLVVAMPTTTDHDELDAVLAWLVRATGALCPLPRTGEWRALCY